MEPQSRNKKKNEFEKWCLEQFNKSFNFGKWDLRRPCSSFVGPDIVINSDLGEEVMLYSPECKRQEQTNLTAWWQQCNANAVKFNLEPVLLFRQNQKKAVAVITKEHFFSFDPNSLGKYSERKHTQFNEPNASQWEPLSYLTKCNTHLIMIRASHFFSLIDRL